MISSPAMAKVTVRTHGDFSCSDKRVDFGAAEIKCSNSKGKILSHWICSYDVGYSCKNIITGEIRKGGFVPAAGDLCSHLCGKLSEKWQ